MAPPRGPGNAPGPSALTWAALFAVYAIAGKLGLTLASVHASATPVWPPTGITLAAFLLLGLRTWPAILAGAFLVNVTTAGSALTSLGIALGNTLEGLCGAWLVNRFAAGARAFQRPADVFRFAALAGLLSTTVSATFGVTSLSLGGFAPWADYVAIWKTWWLGDLGGALVVAPLLILWGTASSLRWSRQPALELAFLLTCLALAGFVIFGDLLPPGHPLSFLSIPPLLWAAFRFGPREAATATALLCGIAIWGAVHGFGPFASDSPNQSLLLLQAFMGVMSVTNLAVAAAVSQRRRAEEVLSQTAAIVATSQDAIIGKALDGTILSWNQGAERLYGYPAEEAVGRNVSMLCPPDRPDEIPQILGRVLRGEGVEPFETVRARRDGRRVVITLALSPIVGAGGNVVGASAIARDITQRKRAEERLATQSAITRVLSESTFLRDAGPRLLAAVCAGLGWDVGELWRAEAGPESLRCEAKTPLPAKGPDVRGAKPSPGRNLAARVFASGQPLWIGDPSGDAVRPPQRELLDEEPREAVAVPVRAEGRLCGALVFYGLWTHRHHEGLLETVGDIGSRLGQFIERERALTGLRRLEKAVETIEMGVTITDMAGRILYTNRAEADLHGYRVEELLGQNVSVFMPAAWRPAAGRPPEIRSWRRETINLRRDGTIFPVQLLSDAVTDSDGTPLGIVTCCEEITERKRAEQALRSSESRYRLLFERNLAGVYRATQSGRLLECNDAFARLLGYSSREEALSRTADEFFLRREDRERSLAHLRAKGTLTNFELEMRRKDGSGVWVLENETLLKGQPGEEDVVQGTLIDITDRKLATERVEFHAYHDALTGLPNRVQLRDRMRGALAQARRSDRGLALMFLDLDNFKVVNDTLGHPAGDRLLQEVGERLKECVREDDTVARVGGDEFVLLLPSVRHAQGAARIARKLLDRIEDAFRIDGHELSVTTSVGIALFPQHGDDEEALLRSADAAMYRAKELGRNGYQFCDAATARQVASTPRP